MKPFDIKSARHKYLNRGKHPIRKLLRTSLELFEARHTGILYGTNHTKIKCLPTTAWDRGIMDAFDGKGPEGWALRWFGKYIVTAKKLSPIHFYKENTPGHRVEKQGIIAHVLRNCVDYYKKGISVIICPDTHNYTEHPDKKYIEIPFFTYQGKTIKKSPDSFRADFRIVRHFQSNNSIYIYLPDYGILVVNTADEELVSMDSNGFIHENILKERLDFLIEIVNLSSLAQLEHIRGKEKAELLWRKEKHLRNISKELMINVKKYRELYETAPIAYISMDITGVILNCNQRAEELSGYKRTDLVGKNVTSFLLNPSEKNSIEDKIKEMILTQGSENEIQLQMQPRTGDPIWVNIAVDPVKDHYGSVKELRAMVMDISERKKLEKQLFQSKKLEGVGRISGGIAHDFNNILSPVSGYMDMMLLDTDDKSKAHHQINTIKECVNHAKELVSQMLTFSRQKALALNPVELSGVIEDSMIFVRSSLPTTIKIETRLENTNKMILADKVQIHQLIVNLVTHAYQAIDHEKGTIKIFLMETEDTDILAEKRFKNGALCLTVEDDGQTIHPDSFDKLFDPYFKASSRHKQSGIGLSVAHGIVESHSGKIQIENRDSGGNRFKIYLPVYADQTRSAEKDYGDQEPFNPETVKSVRRGKEIILLVDDETRILDMMTYMFEKLGYTVFSFSNPRKALAFVEDLSKKIDVLITDQTMPDMTGFELAQSVAAIRPELPVVLCSGIGDGQGDELQCEVIKGFLKKPIAVDDVSLILSKLLDGQLC